MLYDLTRAQQRVLVSAVTRSFRTNEITVGEDVRPATLDRLLALKLCVPVLYEPDGTVFRARLTEEAVRLANELAMSDTASYLTDRQQQALVEAKLQEVDGIAMISDHTNVVIELAAQGYATRSGVLTDGGAFLADGLIAKWAGMGSETLPRRMWQTAKMPYIPKSPSQLNIHDAAGGAGWKLYHRAGDEVSTHSVLYQRGADFLRVSFASGQGRFTKAVASGWQFDYRAQALSYLRRNPADADWQPPEAA